MKKIHIALVGRQTAPVYSGIVEMSPDEVILIHSKETLQEAKIIKEEIGIECIMINFDSVNLKEIKSKVALLRSKYEKEEISINLSSGTKPWTIYFYAAFKDHPNCHFFYIDQNNNIGDFDTCETHSIPFDIERQFRLYGTSLKDYNLYSSYTNDDSIVCKEIEKIRNFDFISFNTLICPNTRKEQNELRHKQGERYIDNGSFVKWDRTEKVQHVEISILKGNRCVENRFDSPHAVKLLFSSGWFEYKIAQILSGYDKVKEIRMNCVFHSKNNSTQNEVDIIANVGNKLLFVECKTQIKDITDIDKFNTVVRTYGGMSSKKMFITNEKLKENVIEKCENNGVAHISIKDDEDNFKDRLFKLLDSTLQSTNKQ